MYCVLLFFFQLVMMIHEFYGGPELPLCNTLGTAVLCLYQSVNGFWFWCDKCLGSILMFPPHSCKDNVTVRKGKVIGKDNHLFLDYDTQGI